MTNSPSLCPHLLSCLQAGMLKNPLRTEKKPRASRHSQFASAYAACCLAVLLTCQSTNVSECYRPVRKRTDPTARRGLGVSDALASGPVLLLNYVGVDAQCKAAPRATQHQPRLEPLHSPLELCSSCATWVVMEGWMLLLA